MKYSKQRDIILKEVNKSYNHPTAIMIYDKVKEEIPNISLGTVYRNLNLLSEKENIKKICMPTGCDRFDKTICDHSHFYCINCNKVCDIDHKIIDEMIETIKDKIEFEITNYNILFEGKCTHCKEKKEG